MKKYLVVEFALIVFGALLLLSLIALGELGLAELVAIPQAVLGLVYVLFLPGYTLQSLLFPRHADLDSTERAVLAFVLSGASVPLIVLLLDALPWGIRLWPVVLSMSLLVIISASASFGVRQRLPAGQASDPLSRLNIRRWWAGQERTNRIVYGLLAAILGVALLTAISIVVLPQPADFYTEFYILGQEGRPENYPRQAVLGETLQVTMGINNHERTGRSYHIEIWVQDPLDASRRQQVGLFGTYDLEKGESIEAPLSWGMPWEGEDQVVEFLLFSSGEQGVYRELRLWLDVTEEP